MLKIWCAICKPNQTTKTEEVIDFLSDGCVVCGAEIEQPTKGRKRIYCDSCGQSHTQSRDRWQMYKRKITEANDNVAFSHLRRFKYMSFDGRYEGPSGLCFTVVTGLRFDRGYKPMPIDVHVKPIEPQFNNVTPQDVEWGLRQGSQHSRYATAGDGARTAYPPSRSLSEPQTNYCPHCSQSTTEVVMTLKREYWIDKGRMVHEDKVVPTKVSKITRGKYVLQGHVCTAKNAV